MESNNPSATAKDCKETALDGLDIKFGDMDNYVVHGKLGRGRYSHVLDGTDRRTNARVAIKVLVPIRKEKIKREYQIMRSLDHPNIAKLIQVVQCPYLRQTSFIEEYVPHVDLRKLYQSFTLSDIRLYMKQLFKALHYLHASGIMHRDVKPLNVLINPSKGTLKLIDFSLSDYYAPSKENNEHVSSLYYKAPELLFSNPWYDYRVDVWGAGMLMAGLVFQKVPLIQGVDLIDQVIRVTKFLGTNEVVAYIKQYKLTERKGHAKENICLDIIMAHKGGDMAIDEPSTFKEFVNDKNKDSCTAEVIDLLQKLLHLDYVHVWQCRRND